jgi:hypothetical protein
MSTDTDPDHTGLPAGTAITGPPAGTAAGGPPVDPADDPTAPIPVTGPAPRAGDLDALDAFPALDGDDEWPVAGPASGLRVPVPVAALTLAVVALLGAAGGARLRGAETGTPARAGGDNPAAAAGAGAPGQGGFGGRGGGQGGAGGAGGGVSGTVQSVNGDHITLAAANGQTVTVTLGAGTTITKTATGAPADIAAGQTLTVRGTTAADGTTTAASIAIVPAGAGPGGRAGAPAPAPPTSAP